MSRIRILPFCAAGIALAGCAANVGPSPDAAAGADNVVRTYTYYDANHLASIDGQPSAQAIYNVNHGTWLWPPASSNDRKH
ncbi:MAG TPA: hypothetical protein VNW90_20325 [Acetobacteraceae bacterium]|nr:hypothetical protein [Acetobacteraceae bacterium]